MSQPPFDPTKAVTFDLVHGLVHLEDAPTRLLVPASALATLAQAAGPEATTAFARALGEPLGIRVARRLSGEKGQGVREATVDTVVDHLGGELALVGLGSLSLERWGKAMILVVDQCPLAGDAGGLLTGVLEAALRRATGSELQCVHLMRDRVRARMLITGGPAAEKARALLRDGVSWGEVLARLHAPLEEPRGAA
jgi:hypothetical protein